MTAQDSCLGAATSRRDELEAAASTHRLSARPSHSGDAFGTSSALGRTGWGWL